MQIRPYTYPEIRVMFSLTKVFPVKVVTAFSRQIGQSLFGLFSQFRTVPGNRFFTHQGRNSEYEIVLVLQEKFNR